MSFSQDIQYENSVDITPRTLFISKKECMWSGTWKSKLFPDSVFGNCNLILPLPLGSWDVQNQKKMALDVCLFYGYNTNIILHYEGKYCQGEQHSIPCKLIAEGEENTLFRIQSHQNDRPITFITTSIESHQISGHYQTQNPYDEGFFQFNPPKYSKQTF